MIAANWKMNKTVGEAEAFLHDFIPLVKEVRDTDIVIAPPFTALSAVASRIKETPVQLAAQNMFYEEKGAYTGEIAPGMLTDLCCTYAILGHSERRQYFGETDEILNRKVKVARSYGLTVIFCIGESLEEREAGQTFSVLQREVQEGLKGVGPEGIVIAYEPIWAIGTGKTATTGQAQEAHRFIREKLSALYGDAASSIRILYGGSVTPENIDALMKCADIDGALVGGASLKPDSFARLVNFTR